MGRGFRPRGAPAGRRASGAVPLGEGIVERVASTPAGYGRKVALLAAFHVALDLVCVALVIAIVARARHPVTLAQRASVETALPAIVLLLFNASVIAFPPWVPSK